MDTAENKGSYLETALVVPSINVTVRSQDLASFRDTAFNVT